MGGKYSVTSYLTWLLLSSHEKQTLRLQRLKKNLTAVKNAKLRRAVFFGLNSTRETGVRSNRSVRHVYLDLWLVQREVHLSSIQKTAARMVCLSDSGQRSRSVLLAPGRPKSRRTDRYSTLHTYCCSETAFMAECILQGLQKHDARILE